MLLKWANAIHMFQPDFTPATHTKICSSHFIESDYNLSFTGKKMLKKEAVPSVFKLAMFFLILKHVRNYSMLKWSKSLMMKKEEIYYKCQWMKKILKNLTSDHLKDEKKVNENCFSLLKLLLYVLNGLVDKVMFSVQCSMDLLPKTGLGFYAILTSNHEFKYR
ncbi:uncharacterized protein LOC126845282 isoform X1 [Adelges cooleyi]|uniref:uncharacterized protein LOC126845282 isoform X1 n=1 Tax=Adelges cooleyi TaxID=133065 RepID=UPI00218030AC|nr:uncharacterized protein LOC126845282 isoform X1 [Adelges cooleyi]